MLEQGERVVAGEDELAALRGKRREEARALVDARGVERHLYANRSEASGTIVMGDNVRISTVAIAQGNLTIRITETPQVSQPAPFSNGGTTKEVPRTKIEIQEDKDNKLTLLANSVTLQELVNGINALGIGPRDMISILQAIKAAGAMQAEIEVL